MDFIEALDDDTCRKDDVHLFGLKSVQIMIEEHFLYWRRFSVLFHGFPLLI